MSPAFGRNGFFDHPCTAEVTRARVGEGVSQGPPPPRASRAFTSGLENSIENLAPLVLERRQPHNRICRSTRPYQLTSGIGAAPSANLNPGANDPAQPFAATPRQN